MREKFSDEEVRQINESYWQDEATAFEPRGRVTCPHCRKPVTVLVSKNVGAPYQMSAHCDGCDRSAASFYSAPAKGEDLSAEEIRAAVEMHQAGRRPRCPHDNTPLKPRERRALGGKLAYKFDCPRCGAFGSSRCAENHSALRPNERTANPAPAAQSIDTHRASAGVTASGQANALKKEITMPKSGPAASALSTIANAAGYRAAAAPAPSK